MTVLLRRQSVTLKGFSSLTQSNNVFSIPEHLRLSINTGPLLTPLLITAPELLQTTILKIHVITKNVNYFYYNPSDKNDLSIQ